MLAVHGRDLAEFGQDCALSREIYSNQRADRVQGLAEYDLNIGGCELVGGDAKQKRDPAVDASCEGGCDSYVGDCRLNKGCEAKVCFDLAERIGERGGGAAARAFDHDH